MRCCPALTSCKHGCEQPAYPREVHQLQCHWQVTLPAPFITSPAVHFNVELGPNLRHARTQVSERFTVVTVSAVTSAQHSTAQHSTAIQHSTA